MLQWNRLSAHGARNRLWRWIVDEIVRAPLEPILHPSTTRLQWLGVFTIAGHLLFGFLWGQVLPQPFEDHWVRLALAFTGLLLLLPLINRDLHAQTTVWVYTFVFWLQLPVFFGWMFLMNGGNKVWLASVCSMVLIYFHITDWRMATVGTVTGFLLSALFFLLSRTEQTWVAVEAENLLLIAFAFVMSLMLGMSSANLRRVRLINTLSTIGVMAHELRTPLATVNLLGDVIRGLAQGDVPDTKRKKLEELSTRLQTLVRSLNRHIDTQISNAQLLRLPRPNTHLSAVEVVQEVIAQYPFKSHRERDCIALSLEQDFEFLGSKAQYSQVLVNLIKNALHSLATKGDLPSVGDLSIRVLSTGDLGQIVVADKGAGIPQQKQQRIFEPFFSLQSSVGNGLGLTFCKNVIEASDGRLLLQSELGEGAVFTIELPTRDTRTPFVAPTSFG